MDYKFYVFSKKYKNHVLKTHIKLPSGQNNPLRSCQGMQYEDFHTGSCYISIVANFVYFQKGRRTVCRKLNTNSPNHSNTLLPCLPTSLSPCLPTSFPIKTPLSMVD